MSTEETEVVKYLRLYSGEELVAFAEETETDYVLTKPVEMYVVSYYEEGSQMINFKEFLPPTVVNVKICMIPRENVMLYLDVNDDFRNQYTEMCKTLYSDSRNIAKKKVEQSIGDGDKVLSLVEALIEKKNKPVH